MSQDSTGAISLTAGGTAGGDEERRKVMSRGVKRQPNSQGGVHRHTSATTEAESGPNGPLLTCMRLHSEQDAREGAFSRGTMTREFKAV